MCPPRTREKRTHQRFKQMCRVSKEPLTRHRRLLDQGHGQAPAPHPPVKQECCQQPALHLHGPTVAQVSCHRSLHHHSHHCDQQMQEDENTSVSWDLVDTDTDAEVTNINLAPTHQTVTNQNCADSIKATSGSSNYGSPKQNTRDNNVASAQVRGNQSWSGKSPGSTKYFCTTDSFQFISTSSIFPNTFSSTPRPTVKCLCSSFSSSIGPVCGYILDDERRQPRKCKHNKHHRRITEDHDAVCRCVAPNHTEGSGSPSRRKQKCKVRQTV